MTFIEDLHEGVDRLAQFAELDCETTSLVAGVGCLSDTSVRDALAAVAALSRDVQKLELALAGVIARRSTRQAGHAGLAQTGGFRTPAQMVQEVTGVSRSEANRIVAVGETLADGALVAGIDAEAAADDRADAEPAPAPWHTPLGAALMSGAATRAQVDVIRRGLGEPPAIDGRTERDVVEVWRMAAVRLIDEASTTSVEELAASARTLRDAIDPAGAEARWADHYEARSFRMRVDADGRTHGHLVFDDVNAEFWKAVMQAALRPRRGGPRFMTDEERAQAADLVDDPRSNDQLAYDLLTDLVRAGATAEAKDVFGARQPGVRLVTVRDAVMGDDGASEGADADQPHRDAFGRLLAVVHTDDGATTFPGSILDRMLCETGSVPVTVDACGNPLDVGREERLFTPRQRIALAVRDGGCRWPGCDRPPAMTEAHHIDHWHADAGRTDIDRGVLLCAYHHTHLHARGWKIVRDGKGPFLLIPPPGETASDDPIEMRSTAPLRWLFDPPERRPWRRPAAA